MAGNYQNQIASFTNSKFQKILKRLVLASAGHILYTSDFVCITSRNAATAVFAPFRVNVVTVLNALNEFSNFFVISREKFIYIVSAFFGPCHKLVFILNQDLYAGQVIQRPIRNLEPAEFCRRTFTVLRKDDESYHGGNFKGERRVITVYLSIVFDAFAPHPVDRGFDLGLHAADQFAVGVDEGLLGFDLGDDGALGGELGEVDFHFEQIGSVDL